MSDATAIAEGSDDEHGSFALRPDRLADSVVLLVTMTLVQRVAGFVRGLLACRWLEPEELGQWDMASGFLMLAAPLIVLGVPGSFGRYCEYYRRRGQLKIFLRRSLVFTVIGTVVGAVGLALAGPWFAELIFGDARQAPLVWMLAATLTSLIVFNFTSELFTSLRLYRFNSMLQFGNSLLFATLSIVLMIFWRPDTAALIAAFGLACLLSFLFSWRWLARTWNSLPAPTSSLGQSELWRRLLPFAMWVWTVNFLSNLFETIDRYMLLHCSARPEAEAITLVGQYHSARVIPLVLVSVAALLGAMLVPHLSFDWESGRRGTVAARVRLGYKLLGLGLSVAACAVMWIAPLLFETVFHGKYTGGLEVLPLTLSYCTWMGLIYLLEKFLWCAEKAHLASIAFAVGLVTNIVLNYLLLPSMGLAGAVLATTIGNLLTLDCVFTFCSWVGMRSDRGFWLVTCLPAIMPLGPWVMAAAIVVLALLSLRGNWMFDDEERRELGGFLSASLERVRRLRRSRTAWPT